MSSSAPSHTSGRAIGIDLGTTYSCAAIFRDGRPCVIANDLGKRTTPSIVAFTDEERLIGDAAANQMCYNPINTLYAAKRLIGRRLFTVDQQGNQVPDEEVANDVKHWPFTVVADDVGNPRLVANHMGERKEFPPEQISAMVLEKMRAISSSFVGEDVKNAVITVPAYFNEAQRDATRIAGQLAGLHVLRIINEPTAAAFAYGLDKLKEKMNIVVFDYGGGTLDVTVMRCMEGVFKVISTSGDTHLGGEDLDNTIVSHILTTWSKRSGKSIDVVNPKMLMRLKRAAETAKCTLSSPEAVRATVNVPSFYEGDDLNVDLSRAKFEELTGSYFNRCIEKMKDALTDGKVDPDTVKHVVLVGGSSRIPKIQQLIVKFFGGRQDVLCKTINPDEAVACGAAIQAAILSDSDDERLADIILVDVTPLSIGVEVQNGLMSRLIERNATIPCKVKRTYSTVYDNQPSVLVKLFEGERAETANNRLLGKFELIGIPPMRAGKPRVELVLELDASGILHVTAEDLSSGRKKDVVINRSNVSLSTDDVARMIEEAEQYKEQDRLVQKRAQLFNKLETYTSSIRDTWQDLKGITDEDRSRGHSLVVAEEEWIDENRKASVEELEARYTALFDQINPIIEGVAKASSSSSG
jgi:L1 cell adhesion molecule like protein